MSSYSKRTIAPNVAAELAALREQLAAMTATLQALVERVGAGERGSFTLAEFRKRHNLSESQYHKLRREGRGPRTMSTGDVGVRISREAEADWIADREREAAAPQTTAA